MVEERVTESHFEMVSFQENNWGEIWAEEPAYPKAWQLTEACML